MLCLFTTQRLKIRNLRESDLDDFHLYRSNPEVTKYQGFDTYTREQAKSLSQNIKINYSSFRVNGFNMPLKISATGQLVGDCAIYLHPSDSRIAELGITISHLHQRQGYAKETMLGLMNFLFSKKGIHRIEETVDAENLRFHSDDGKSLIPEGSAFH